MLREALTGRRIAITGATGFLGTALAAYAVLVSDFHVAYQDFLVLTYLWAPAWAAVVLLAVFAFDRRGRPGDAVAAWFLGTALSLIFVNYQNLFGNVTAEPFFNQPLIDAMHGADISGLVSVAVAACVYFAARMLRPA